MISRGNPLLIAYVLITVMRVFSVLSLTCHQTEYQIDNECCPLCPPGSRVKIDCTEFRSTSCVPCGEGSYMDKPNGQKHCLTCTVCDPGSGLKVKQRCSPTSDTVCEALERFFCTSFTSGSCSAANKHTTCGPGQYITKTGTWSSDAECSDCSSGTFSNESSTSCQPHTQCETLNLRLIKAGTASADAECGEKISPGSIAGIIVGIIVVIIVVLLIVLIVSLWKRRKLPTLRGCLNFTRKTPNQAQQMNPVNKEDSVENRLMPSQNSNIQQEP